MSSSPFSSPRHKRHSFLYSVSPKLLLHRDTDSEQTQLQANLCVYFNVYFFFMWINSVCHSPPVAAGPARVAVCRSSPRGSEPPPPPPGTHSSPGARRATQTGSRSGSAAHRYVPYTRKWEGVKQLKILMITWICWDIPYNHCLL